MAKIIQPAGRFRSAPDEHSINLLLPAVVSVPLTTAALARPSAARAPLLNPNHNAWINKFPNRHAHGYVYEVYTIHIQ